MPSSDGGERPAPSPRRAFGDTAWGKAVLLLLVFGLAVVASRSCASRDTEITKERAAEIARAEVDFRPDNVMTRFVPRGFNSRPTWAVSLSTDGPDGELRNVTVVVVDANDGHVIEVRRGA
jgi:hypothetical protein